MRALTTAAAIAGLLLPAFAGAEEIDLGWFGSAEYDDNVFNTDQSGDATDDFVLRTGPILGMRRTQGDITYDIRYEPRWETFVQESGLDEFDHAAFGRLRWQVDPTTSVTATNRFGVTHSLNRATFIPDPAAPDVPPSLDIEVDRQEIIQNHASLEIVHSFTPRLRGVLTGSQSIFRTDREDRFDDNTYNGNGEMLYTITPRDQVGGGFRVNFQDFDDIENPDGSVQEGQDVTTYNPFVKWVHTFDPTLTLSMQAGPTWVDVDRPEPPDQALVVPFPVRANRGGVSFIDANTCPRDEGQPILAAECEVHEAIFLGDAANFILNDINGQPATVFLVEDRADTGGDVTIFAAVSLSKRWGDRLRSTLTYQRQDSNSSGVGQSTIIDVLALSMIWEPFHRWSVSFLAQASMREQTTEQEGTVIGLMPSSVIVEDIFIPGIGIISALAPASRSASLRLVDAGSVQESLSYRVNLRIKRRLGRRSEVFGAIDYLWQDIDNDFDDRRFDGFRVLLGARWMFDPINVL